VSQTALQEFSALWLGLTYALQACRACRAFTPDLGDWGTSLGPLGTLMSVCGSLASAEVWDPLPQLLYCTVLLCVVSNLNRVYVLEEC
jgi:hypothetical protein